MAYVTGTANTFDAIIAAIQSACVANGWTLTNDILSKGTCFARIWKPSSTRIRVTCGRGQTGGSGSTLTGLANAASRGVGETFYNVPFTFPVTYHIHIFSAPDEVYVFLNYGTSYYARIMFGQSNVSGLAGTGNFYDASFQGGSDDFRSGYSPDIRLGGSIDFCPFPFGNYVGYVGGDSGLDHSLNADPYWSGTYMTQAGSTATLLRNTPSAWNGESVLVPARAYIGLSGFTALVLELQNMRLLSMDNLDPEAIITIGTDKWKVYPCWRKGTRARYFDGGQVSLAAGDVPNSSTYATAIRYDGP